MRRSIASLLLFCFAIFSMEVVVADVHDGDASAVEVARLAPGDAAPSAPAALGEGGAPADGDAPASSRHTMHACHCVHTHGSISSRAITISATTAICPRRSLTLDALAPTSVVLDAHLRPPIA